MTKYLITFPAAAMTLTGAVLQRASVESHALAWAAKFASVCGCPQELREFMYNPES